MQSKPFAVTYYNNNNTILLVNSTLNNLVLFSQNGAYIPIQVVINLLAGFWRNLEYDTSACVTQPPANISIRILEMYGALNIYSPSTSYYDSSSNTMKNVILQLSVSPQINQPVWQMAYTDALGYANISYTINPTTNQSILQLHVLLHLS